MIAPTRRRRVVVLLLMAIGCHQGGGDDRASAGEADALSVRLADGKHTITFRRLPKIADATPLASVKGTGAAEDAESRPYELPSVYLAEQELSLFELRALVSDKTWAAYVARVLAYTGTDDDLKFGSYRNAVRDGSDKFPAILVDLEMILEACNTLDKLATDRPETLSLHSDLAAVGFRIPSRIEWQYAARGTQDAGEAQAREIFPKWPQFDTKLEGQWLDLCQKSGIDPDRRPTPTEVCEMADSLLTNKQSKEGYEFLGEVLKQALGFEVNIFRTADQAILQVDPEAVAPWGFRRLLGNASEWTMDGRSLQDVESLWKSLKRADLATLSKDTRTLGMIMGGQFLNTVPQPRSWTKFSIADGQSKEGAAFSVQDACGRAPNGDVLEDFVSLKAGVRLCVRRSVSPQWFVPYRRAFRQGQDVDKLNEAYRETFRDLCIASEFDTLARVLDAYQMAPQVAEASDDAARVAVFTDSMIAAARTFGDKATGPAQNESAADDAVRRLRSLGIGGSTRREVPQATTGGQGTSGAKPKRSRGQAPKPDFFNVLGSVNRS